uniref:Uncharacterized protein n=1 Tax=Anguilla anguilla TaxID=7936 RepID=A0A0E9PBS0_ANGAN
MFLVRVITCISSSTCKSCAAVVQHYYYSMDCSLIVFKNDNI